MLNYSYKYTYNYMIIFEFMYVYLLKIVDYIMNTIGDMQNEKYFSDHYIEFEYNHDYVIFC